MDQLIATSLLPLCLLIGGVYSTPFTNCPSGAAVAAFDIGGCEMEPCRVKELANVTLTVNFTSRVRTNDIKLKIVDVGNSFNETTDLGSCCPYLVKGSCPVSVGEEISYRRTVLVPEETKSAYLTHFIISGSKNEVVACLRVRTILY